MVADAVEDRNEEASKGGVLLAIEDVSVQFGGVRAVSNVSIEMRPGEKLGLVGPNGAGKTTLFNAVSGLAKPTGGTIRFRGRVVDRMPEYRRARLGIGRTFQIPQPMHGLTVRENLIVAQRFSRGAIDQSRLDEILELLELVPYWRSRADELTLAQLKALEVAKALAMEPSLLLLDEVLAGFEQMSKAAFAAKLIAVQRRFGMGLLVIEHDIEAITQICERVCVLNFGELIADGEPAVVFNDPKVVDSYTGANDD